MAVIPQTGLFSWEDVENLGELRRLQLVLKTMPDEALMRALEAERANGRFERHFIRGHNKMRLRCSLGLIVMLAMALGRVKEKQKDKMRSLVCVA